MATTLEALVPIFAWFVVGVVLRSCGVASRENAALMFRLVFFVTLPALAFVTISRTELTLQSSALPLAGFLVNLFCTAIAFAYARMRNVDRRIAGTVMLGAGIANTAFVFPFILGVLGPDAFAQAVLYDLGNAMFVAAIAYGIAIRYGESGESAVLLSVVKVLRTPLLLAVFAAIIVSLANVEIPRLLDGILSPLGAATIPLIMLALGASMSAARLRDPVVYGTVLMRMVGGLIVGLSLAIAVGLGREGAVVVVALASAPIGFNVVTLTSMGKLDVEHATAALSMSIVIGLFTATAIVLAGARWLATAG